MACDDCGCDLDRCRDGCVYTWRERFTWWMSRTFRLSLIERFRKD